MSRVRYTDFGQFYRADTGPVLEFLFLQQDGNSVMDLTGRAGWVTFWLADASAPHVTRGAQVDGSNGILRYFPQGDEAPTAGKDLNMQATQVTIDATPGNDRAWFRISHPIVKRAIVEKP